MSVLAGRTALVTGASRRIGRGVAERLGRDGARVAVHYGSKQAAAEETVAAIEAAGGSAFAIGVEPGVPGRARRLGGVRPARGRPGHPGEQRGNRQGRTERGDRRGGVPPGLRREREGAVLRRPARPGRLRDGGRIINVSSGLGRTAVMPDQVAYR